MAFEQSISINLAFRVLIGLLDSMYSILHYKIHIKLCRYVANYEVYYKTTLHVIIKEAGHDDVV